MEEDVGTISIRLEFYHGWPIYTKIDLELK